MKDSEINYNTIINDIVNNCDIKTITYSSPKVKIKDGLVTAEQGCISKKTIDLLITKGLTIIT